MAAIANPFDPKLEPQYNKVAAKLLTGKQVSVDDLRKASPTGKLSPRSLGVILNRLEALGAVFYKGRTNLDVGVEYKYLPEETMTPAKRLLARGLTGGKKVATPNGETAPQKPAKAATKVAKARKATKATKTTKNGTKSATVTKIKKKVAPKRGGAVAHTAKATAKKMARVAS